MRKYLVSLLMALIPILAQAEPNCLKNPIYCDILKLKPSVDRELAVKLSNSVARYSRKFGIDPKISIAIAMQESSFKNVNRLGTVLTKRNHVVHGITDIGVFQIHIETISDLKDSGSDIDVERLKVDVDYQAFWHAKILKKKMSVCKIKREKLQVAAGQEWSCYHSFTEEERETYVDYVDPYLKKLSL